MKNLGKQFEQNFRKSIPENNNIFYYRLKDNNNNWNRGKNIRFAGSNIADAILFWAGEYKNLLFILEFKHHKGKSLPLNCIRKNQLDEMTLASKKTDIIPVIVVFFSDIEKCYSISIDNVNIFTKHNARKSIPLEYFESYGVPIETTKLKSNYKYNIEEWLNNF